MFIRIAAKAMTHRRSRLAVATLALVVGSTITTAMLSVYYDAGRKISRELRAYGPNIMVGPKDGALLDQGAMDRVVSDRWPAELVAAAPFLYIVAEARQNPSVPTQGTASARSASVAPASQSPGVAVVVAGTWLDQARTASPWWKVSGSWIESRDDESDCLVGAHLASQLRLNRNDRIELSYGDPEAPGGGVTTDEPSRWTRGSMAGSLPSSNEAETAISRRGTFIVNGILDTGGPEDDQVLVSLKAAQRLSGLHGLLSAIAMSASGNPDRIESLGASIDSRIPGARADLVRQIAQGEGRVLSRLRLTMLLVAIVILAAASLSVGTTLVALVMDRQREFGAMKAIGAENSDLLRLFLVELGVLGLGGGIIGYALGIVVAQPIGRSLFNSPVAPRGAVFAIILVISLAVAMLSGILPIKRIKEVEPAVILRGD